MAKKEKEAKIVLERTYNVPLRRRWHYVPRYKRAKKAITTLKVFLIKHMKPGKDEKGRILLKLGKYLNEDVWKHGMKNPPHHIQVDAKKDEKGLVTVELTGAPKEEKKEEKKAGKEKTPKEKPGTQTSKRESDFSPEEKKEVPKKEEAPKEASKEEAKPAEEKKEG